MTSTTLGHTFELRDGRRLHLASCSCWRGPAPARCRYCSQDHAATGVVCRWVKWLRRG